MSIDIALIADYVEHCGDNWSWDEDHWLMSGQWDTILSASCDHGPDDIVGVTSGLAGTSEILTSLPEILREFLAKADRIIELDEMVDSLQGHCDRLTTDLDLAEETISSLEEQVNGQAGLIDSLERLVDSLRDQLDALDGLCGRGSE